MTTPSRRRRLYDFSPPSPAPTPGRVSLADGTVLTQLSPAVPRQLGVHDWILLDGLPYQIQDMRWRHGDGRILHLAGCTVPYPVTAADTIQRFDLVIPPR